MTLIRVAAYTGGRLGPSARFRVRQYLPRLESGGVAVTEFASRVGRYPPKQKWRRPGWAAARISEGVWRSVGSHVYDMVLFQRELLSTMVTAESLYGRPRVLDVDDAIWLHRRGSFALKLGRLCDAVICGNRYLADYFAASGRPVHVLPTAVDTHRFVPAQQTSGRKLVMGWSGSSSNLRFLEAIEHALVVVMQRFPQVCLRVVCDRQPRFSHLPADRVQFVQWNQDVEVTALQDLAVGLMPLEDSEWARGKCAFKMLTYMACGVPVVVSPVGMNADVLAQGEIGFGARDTDEWVDALSSLLSDSELSRCMSETARHVVERHYSLDVLVDRFAAILRHVASGEDGTYFADVQV